MVKLVVLAEDGARFELELAPGDLVMDARDEQGAPLSFSCRGATCGVCRVRVASGSALLDPPLEEERETLGRLAAAADERLACRLKAAAGSGTVEVRPFHRHP